MTARALLSGVALIGVVTLGTSGGAWAQGQERKVDLGKREFESNCASCHGMKAKGDGPYTPFLTRKPSDLTGLSKANDGVFPYQRVYQIIDGRIEVAAHGKRDMPVWGTDYLVQAGAFYMEVPYDPEAFVRARIVALIDYVHRLQMR
jgi:mono/diheme cytochrome c family protein